MPKKRGRPSKNKENNFIQEIGNHLETIGVLPKLTATIKVLGVLYTSVGRTKDECIANLVVPKGRGVSIITISNGNKSQEKVFSGIQTERLFSKSPNVRMHALKNTCLRFDL